MGELNDAEKVRILEKYLIDARLKLAEERQASAWQKLQLDRIRDKSVSLESKLKDPELKSLAHEITRIVYDVHYERKVTK